MELTLARQCAASQGRRQEMTSSVCWQEARMLVPPSRPCRALEAHAFQFGELN